MRYTIDRFEEDFALLEAEDGTMLQALRSSLPPEVREGDKLDLSEAGCTLLPKETQASRAEADERLQRLLDRTRKRRDGDGTAPR